MSFVRFLSFFLDAICAFSFLFLPLFRDSVSIYFAFSSLSPENSRSTGKIEIKLRELSSSSSSSSIVVSYQSLQASRHDAA